MEQDSHLVRSVISCTPLLLKQVLIWEDINTRLFRVSKE